MTRMLAAVGEIVSRRRLDRDARSPHATADAGRMCGPTGHTAG